MAGFGGAENGSQIHRFLKQDYFEGLTDVSAVVGEEKDKNRTPLESAKTFCEYVYKNFKYKKGITTCRNDARRSLENKIRRVPGLCAHAFGNAPALLISRHGMSAATSAQTKRYAG